MASFNTDYPTSALGVIESLFETRPRRSTDRCGDELEFIEAAQRKRGGADCAGRKSEVERLLPEFDLTERGISGGQLGEADFALTRPDRCFYASSGVQLRATDCDGGMRLTVCANKL